MSLSVGVGLLLAVATAGASLLGFLYTHRGLQDAPELDWRTPGGAALALARSPLYVRGLAVVGGSWILHVAALALAPISLVQAVISGCLVLLTVLADRLFGIDVTRREWIGVGLSALGLAFLGATLNGTADNAHASFAAGELSIYLALLLAAGAALAVGVRGGHAGAVLGASAGLMWSASNIAIKALSGVGGGPVALLLHPLILVIGLTLGLGVAISARSLQLGDAVPVIAVTSVVGNLPAIAAGPIVFGEPLPSDPLNLTLRISAFALVLVATALTPTPATVSPKAE